MVDFCGNIPWWHDSRIQESGVTRPKRNGLWVVLNFKDGSNLEGTISNNLLALQPWTGKLLVTMGYSGASRCFNWSFDTDSIESCEVLGVCGARSLLDSNR